MPKCVNEFILEIQHMLPAAGDVILPAELELLESFLPELLLAMIQAEELDETA